MEIMYKNSIDIFISSARIVWLDSRRKDTEMTLTNGEWRTEAYLPQGRYLYRLVINNRIWINDPMANLYMTDNNGNTLWSVLAVNEHGKRLYNNSRYSLNITHFSICGDTKNKTNPAEKNSFLSGNDQSVALTMSFSDISGVHTVTVLWINPIGCVFDVTECSLFDIGRPQTIWFGLNLRKPKMTYIPGNWVIAVLIDGKKILAEKMNIRHPSDAYKHLSLNIKI